MKATWKQKAILALLPVGLLLLAEGTARALYFFRSGFDARYLIAPVGGVRIPVVYPMGPQWTYSEYLPRLGKTLTFTVNREGGRGRDWPSKKPAGTRRIAAVGASSTFGMTNPDGSTWPAFLERALQARPEGRGVQVLNAGLPGYALKDFTRFFQDTLARYEPDTVLYYEGWNDTLLPVNAQVHHNVRRFQTRSPIGRLSFFLYGRSMLYTYLLEKAQFSVAAAKKWIAPDTEAFRTELIQFVRAVQSQGAVPILVLQVLEPEGRTPVAAFERALRGMDLNDASAVEKHILQAIQRDSSAADPLTKLRVYQAGVLLEVVRRTGQDLGIQVIDPRPSFARYAGSEPLFDDVVHLTDLGNRILAEVIAEQLGLSAS